MFISIYAVTVFLLLTAMLIDFGLFYYKQARLQNATDAAATAVAAEFTASDNNLEDVAKNYLKKNGINYDDDKIDIKIVQKGTLKEETADYEYITSGYLKVTVKIDSGTVLGPILNIDSLTLHSSSFVKVNADYDQKLYQLNYSIFAGSSDGTKENPAASLNGKTGNITNYLTSSTEKILNRFNENFIQKVKGFFGGTPDYTDWVHLNLSEVITNGDVHSNSNVSIGAQSVNLSRVKDDNLQQIKTDSDGNPVYKRDANGNILYQTDENGNKVTKTKYDSNGDPIVKKDSNGNVVYKKDSNGGYVTKTDDNGNPVYKKDSDGNLIPKKDSDGNELKDSDGNTIYETEYQEEYETEYVPLYQYESFTQNAKNDNSYLDYGQVVVEAVGDIQFKNTSQSGNYDATHLYVQNQQKLEQTKAILSILNMIDFSSVDSTAQLKSQFETKAAEYFEAQKSFITSEQQTQIRNKAENMSYSDGTVYLPMQELLVYDVNQATGNDMLRVADEDRQNGETTNEDGVKFINSRLVSQLRSVGEDELYAGNTKTLLFQNIADTMDTDKLSETYTLGTNTTAKVVVSGVTVNRDYEKTGSDGIGSDYTGTKQAVGAKYAMYQTFLENRGEDAYYTMPNLKPYFIRQTNKSISQSVKTRDTFDDADTLVKETVRSAVAELTEDLQAQLDNTKYEDATYSDFSAAVKKDTSPLFTHHMATKSGGLTTLTGDDHTSYNGYELYNSDDVLKTPSEFVDEFKKSNITEDKNGESKYSTGAVKKYFDENIANSGSDKDKYETNYADDAVQKKKASIEAKVDSIDDKKNKILDDGTYLRLKGYTIPLKSDVFLGPEIAGLSIYEKRVEFNTIIDKFSTAPALKNAQQAEKAGITDSSKSSYSASFNIDDYMPAVDTTNHTVTAKETAKLGDSSVSATNFKVTSDTSASYLVDGKGKWFTNGFSKNSGWVRLGEKNNMTSVVVGNMSVSNDNLDVGYNYSGSTLVVTGNLNVGKTLQIRKNCVVFVFGDLTCDELYMYSGARLYVKGSITSRKLTFDSSNQQIYCGGDAVIKSDLTSSRVFKVAGSMTANMIYATASNFYCGGSLSCTKFEADFGLKFVFSEFTCSGESTLNSNKLYVNGNASTAAVTMQNDSVLSVYGTYTSSGTNTLYSTSKIVANGNVSTAAVTLQNDSALNVGGTYTSTGANTLYSSSKLIVNDSASFSGAVSLNNSAQLHINSTATFTNSISMNETSLLLTGGTLTSSGAVSLGGSACIYVDGNFTARRLASSAKNNIIQANSITFTQSNDVDNYFSVSCRFEAYGDISFNCYVNVQADAYILCRGSINFNGLWVYEEGLFNTKTDGETSCDIYGKIYVLGGFNAENRVDLRGATIYCCGDMKVGTSSKSFSNALEIYNASQIYVGGQLSTSTSKSRGIYLGSGTSDSTTLSVYGFGYSYSLGSTISSLINEQANATIYLGNGKITSSNIGNNLTFSGSLTNYGTLYNYGSVSITGDSSSVTLSGGGLTYIYGDLKIGNSSNGGNLTISDGHTLRLYSHLNITKGSATLNGASKVYVTRTTVGGAVTLNDGSYWITTSTYYNASTGNLTLNGGSKFWAFNSTYTGTLIIESSSADNKSDFFSYGNHSITTDSKEVTINGLYLSPNSGESTLKTLYVKQYGELTYLGSFVITGTIKCDAGGYLYTQGKVTLSSGVAVNNGKMYLMGGLDTSASGGATKTTELSLGTDADTFIASNASSGIGTMTLKGYFVGNGNVYIENNLVINGNNEASSVRVGYRYTSLAVTSGNTYISGSATLPTGQAMLVSNGASFSCEEDVNLASALYNLGKCYIYGNLNVDWSKTSYITEQKGGEDMRTGMSLKNGTTEGTVDAFLYIGGTNKLQFYGYVLNFGEIYSNAGMEAQGWLTTGSNKMPSGDAWLGDTAFINYTKSKAYFGGDVNLNSNSCFNGEGSVFSAKGDFTYGIVTINLGDFVVTGGVEMNKNSKNNSSWRNGKSMSFMNGIAKVDGVEYTDATLYVGKTLKIGTTEAAGVGGSYMSMGRSYIGGDLLVYCNRARSYYATAIWAYNRSNTFVGGDVFGGGGIATGNYSVFMCGGDYQSKRSTKINIEMFTYSSSLGQHYFSFCDDNKAMQKNDSYYDKKYMTDEEKSGTSNQNIYRSAYFYVGGNMLCNTIGAGIVSDFSLDTVPENNSRDTDIYSNSNVYVGGSMYCNSKLYMKQNVTLVVAGKKELTDTSTFKGILNAVADSTIKQAIQNAINDDDYKLFIYQLLDENICSKIIVNGSMYVRDTAKMRDMTKNYIYGNFNGRDYVEIGKSLLDDDEDRTQAAVSGGKFWTKGDSLKKYTFANAGYMYVGGKFKSAKYTKLYASTTLRVKDDYTSNKYLTLRHDAKIYVGKKLKALTSIEGGSYSEFHVGGSMQASTSFIKLRDCTTVVVGGNVTALSYIELGKYGDYVRTVNGNTVSEQTAHGVTEGEEPKYDTDQEKGDGYETGSEGDKTDGSTDAGKDPVISDEQRNENYNYQSELANDASDLAKGGYFYVGQALVSYTGYIKEFAYSRVAVGNFVFTPKYLTLRHNADLWVMPETFKNATYMHKPYVDSTDGSIWGDIKNELKKLSYNIQDTFSAKSGSVYVFGELTLNKNASLMGTYDCQVLDQCILKENTMIYFGHDFKLYAPSLNVNVSDLIKGNDTSVAGFYSKGKTVENGDDSETNMPVLIYADNDIDIATTFDMELTYIIANKGDVNIYNIATVTKDNADTKYGLMNAITSYQGDINYDSIYSDIRALFYAPMGNIDLDGWYVSIYGCIIGNTVEDNAYYLNVHRFTNWRTLNLHIASAGDVFLVSEKDYEEAVDNVDDFSLDDSSTDTKFGGSSLFFSRDVLDSIEGENY